jgi:uncharacterized protein (TIGR02600 family)
MALVIVIGALALATMLLLAMFSLTQTEYKSTQSYVAGLSAKQFAETANQLVIAQIQNGQNTATAPTSRTIHATQPGMIRVYHSDGSFDYALKLYSSAQMRVNGPNEVSIFSATSVPPANWETKPSRWVDLNEPAVRPALDGAAGEVSCYFPVIDPRAAFNYHGQQYSPSNPAAKGDRTTQVEGFWFDRATPAIGAAAVVTYNGIRTPDTVGDPNQLRLPMPVEWLYFLQDGTMGTINEANTFVSAVPNVAPSAENPIVARVAFWTDDESCKININTASEPTFMAPPFYYHDRDRRWANYPATSGEYQRYPGHPATVALSSVLAPNFRLDPIRPQDDKFPSNDTTSIIAIKDYIYDLTPKISKGGSECGTLPYITDEFSMNSVNGNPAEGNLTSQFSKTNIDTARAERLYASVDEMLFLDDAKYDTKDGRSAAKRDMPGVPGMSLFDHNTIERSRFFLTAHSRAPEFTIFGLPRVCMWPIADEVARPGGPVASKLRTNFDNMIALCATLRSATGGPNIANSYIFRRSTPHHSTQDVTGSASGYPSSQGLHRNTQLLEYLTRQMSDLDWPQTSLTGNTQNFVTKYGVDNVRQLAVEFFDYIRCTNLYDGVLARGNDASSAASIAGGTTAFYQRKDQLAPLRYTYTEQRMTPPATNVDANANSALGKLAADDAGVLPGHGQVTPAVWSTGGKSYMGFGRMFTLSEVGLHFICTADGGVDEKYDVNFDGVKSGGGTAFRAVPDEDGGNPPSPHYAPNLNFYGGMKVPQTENAVWWSNFPPILFNHELEFESRYGTKSDSPTNPNHPSHHPGFDPANWNLTLAQGVPLEVDEKRVQAIFLMEAFCPMLGWTKFYPEYTIVLDGDFIGQIFLNNKRLFDTTGSIPVKSAGNTWEFANQYSFGGQASPSAVSGNRGGRATSGEGTVLMGSDSNYTTGNTTGHNGLNNYGLTSNFLTVPRTGPMKLEFRAGTELKINIYDTHNWESTQPCQKISLKFEDSPIPTPKLVYNNYGPNPATEPQGKGELRGAELNYHVRVDSAGNIKYRRSTQAPHWWAFNSSGCIGRLRGKVNPEFTYTNGQQFWLSAPGPYPPGAQDTAERQALRGRLDNSAKAQWDPPGTPDGISILPPETGDNGVWESDVVRTMIPALGDYRMIAARYEVPSDMWKRHPLWTNGGLDQYTVHTFSGQWGNLDPGFDLPQGKDRKLLVADVNFGNPASLTDYSRTPDLPPDDEWAKVANSFGDFDTGIANAREGPYINKPDEGNFYAGTFTRNSMTKFYRSGYFYEAWHNSDDWRSGLYMTPNRMISSPVMFGSLPTGVWNIGGSGAGTALTGTSLTDFPARPWQTLLFRPYVSSNLPAFGAKPNHPGDAGPKDHLLLDMFFMPVVEPYAISEPLSVAGRVNMNYQILPFTNIHRSTAMHALMKGEFITAIPDGAVYMAKNFRAQPNTQQVWDQYYDEKTSPQQYWHRPINVDETLEQFEEKFNQLLAGPAASGLFRSASQICEMHLIPDVTAGTSVASGESLPPLVGLTRTTRPTAMRAFWQNHRATGDNVRERPYSNLYARLTTRTNTFRVHVRAQVLKKARSTAPNEFDSTKDSVLSEYRGSTLIERYIDPTDTTNPIPDYAASPNPLNLPPLDTFYQFRVLESKRFNP